MSSLPPSDGFCGTTGYSICELLMRIAPNQKEQHVSFGSAAFPLKRALSSPTFALNQDLTHFAAYPATSTKREGTTAPDTHSWCANMTFLDKVDEAEGQ